MGTLKNLELLYAAALEGVSSFEEMMPLGALQAGPEATESSRELKTTFFVNTESSRAGEPVFASVTLTMRRNGDWEFHSESGRYDFAFDTGGSLEKPKDAGKALEFIDGLNLSYAYEAFEKPTALEAELSAAFGGYLKRLARAEQRGAREREEPIIHGEANPDTAFIPVKAPPEPRMSVEELMDGLDANDALTKLLRKS